MRKTKQKEIILDILTKSKSHPTIQEIYQSAKLLEPKIGQATVYRNVNKLVAEKKILKLPSDTNDGYHYDGNIDPHDHLLCKKCGTIVDLYDNDYKELIDTLEKKHQIKVEKTLVLLEGICSRCTSKS